MIISLFSFISLEKKIWLLCLLINQTYFQWGDHTLRCQQATIYRFHTLTNKQQQKTLTMETCWSVSRGVNIQKTPPPPHQTFHPGCQGASCGVEAGSAEQTSSPGRLEQEWQLRGTPPSHRQSVCKQNTEGRYQAFTFLILTRLGGKKT